MNEEMCLQIPAKQSMMLVARMALSGLCAQFGADLDTLDDIRTACDEACYCLMHQGAGAESLSIRCMSEEPRMRICFTGQRKENEKSEDAGEVVEIARGVLESLVSAVEMRSNEKGLYEIEVLVHLKAI